MTTPHSSRRFSPSLDSNVSVQVAPVRPSLYDNKDEFIERVSPIGMAAIYFGSFSLAPQDAALSRQALYKLSFSYRYFLQPAGVKINVRRETAILSGKIKGACVSQFAEIMARQIEGIETVENEMETSKETGAAGIRDAVHLLFATEQTLRSGIRLAVENNRIALEGEVNSAAQKSWAEFLVAAAGGDLTSRLEVTPLGSSEKIKSPDVDDESLQALIMLRLGLIKETEAVKVRVKATRGVVALQGKVRTEGLRQHVENLTRSTLGLRELRSTLSIAA